MDVDSADEAVLCIPGDRLCACSGGKVSGRGTHEYDGGIYASVAGEVRYSISSGEGGNDENTTTVVSVELPGSASSGTRLHGVGAASVGSKVTAIVDGVHWLHATCRILCVEDVILPSTISAKLRKEDVHAVDKDSTYIGHCFRHGDIILAKVVSMEDKLQWRISTAEPDLGVVFAKSRAGHVMSPVSWSDMKCPVTMEVEKRKCARIPKTLTSELDDAGGGGGAA